MKTLVTSFLFVALSTSTMLSQAQPKFLTGVRQARCPTVVLPTRIYAFESTLPTDALEDLIANDDTELTTQLLTLGDGFDITLVIDSYLRGQNLTLPIAIIRNGEMTWSTTIRNLGSSYDVRDLQRVIVSLTLPRALLTSIFPEQGLYKIVVGEEQSSQGQVCATTIEGWVFADDATLP